jgi:GlpG protein
MIKAATVALDLNLVPLSRTLWRLGVKHRISEESGNQVVWVPTEKESNSVNKLLDGWTSGSLDLDSIESETESNRPLGNQPPSGILSLFQVVQVAPVTMTLIMACIVVAFITGFGSDPYRLGFLFYPRLPNDSLISLLAGIDSLSVFIRTLGPMFLHFGELHIIFNCLWLFYFGRQLEAIQPSWLVLMVVLITSFAGNTAQYLYSGAANFGGMSGVVYGLVGYAWVVHNFVPGKRLMFNRTMFGVFIVALVLMELVASNWIASAAHAGGLVAGLVLGLLLVVQAKIANQT